MKRPHTGRKLLALLLISFTSGNCLAACVVDVDVVDSRTKEVKRFVTRESDTEDTVIVKSPEFLCEVNPMRKGEKSEVTNIVYHSFVLMCQELSSSRGFSNVLVVSPSAGSGIAGVEQFHSMALYDGNADAPKLSKLFEIKAKFGCF